MFSSWLGANMANYYWKDGADDDFLNSDAWLPSGVPQEYDYAYVAVAGTYTVTVSPGESAFVGGLTISNADATLAINGGGLYMDDGLITMGSVVLDNGPYHGAALGARAMEIAGSLSVDAYDGSGGAGVGALFEITLGGALVVGNADLSADTTVSGGGVTGASGIFVTGSMQAGGPQATVYYGGSLSSVDDAVVLTGNAVLYGLDLARIGPTGVILLNGAATISGSAGLNQGTVTVENGASFGSIAGNTGLISVDNGGVCGFDGANDGVISVVNDASDAIVDSTLQLNLTNNGEFYVNNDSPEYLGLNFYALNNQGSFLLDNTAANTAAETYATIGSLQNSGVFQIGGGYAKDTVRVTGAATADHDVMQIGANASLAASLVMTGTADLDVTGGAVSGAVVAEGSTVALVQSGTFDAVSTTLLDGGTEIVSSGLVQGPSIAVGNLLLGQGATLSSPVSFTPSGGSIALFRSSLSSLQVDGLSPLAQVDVFDVPYALGAPAPILVNDAQQHNVLQFSDAQYNLVDLQLDPTANYAGVKFIVQPYLNGVAISEAG